jgi:hypothetical protein
MQQLAGPANLKAPARVIPSAEKAPAEFMQSVVAADANTGARAANELAAEGHSLDYWSGTHVRRPR